jgi:carbon-monoxide dehydrogenase medium subunit
VGGRQARDASAAIGARRVGSPLVTDVLVPELHRPATLDEALAALAVDGSEAIAGGTWIMLAPLHRRPLARRYVAVGALDDLCALDLGDPARIGAAVTHARLAELTGPLAVLGEAARGTPLAIGNVATLAGNLRAAPYPAADLVPALLAADAEVEVASASSRNRVALPDYLGSRAERPAGELVVAAIVPSPPGRRSAFERLSVRGGGEEAVASVALSVDLAGGRVAAARVAVGAVEEVARRCPAAEAALLGEPLSAAAGEAAGAAAGKELEGRDGSDAPGWYRLAVLPALVRRAVERLGAR